MVKHLHKALCLFLLVGCGPKGPGMDMGPAPDKATEDLTTEEDLREPADLRAPRDMRPPQDLRAEPDLRVEPDLRMDPPDMRMDPADMRVDPDMRTDPADMRMGGTDGGMGSGAIGAPCTDDTSCRAGTTPVCWKSTVRNQMGAPATPGGYCSSACTTDGDCGGGRCVSVGGGSFCLASCSDDMTCRHAGYACAYHDRAGVCFPDTIFNCDPTSGSGTCMDGGSPGGCVRGAYENKGTCAPTCNVGPGTCSAVMGVARQCVFFEGAPDPFRGAVCLESAASPRSEGAACSYINECQDGLQCDGFDGKCRKLCKKGGMPACSMPATCADAWMSGTGGPGICR